MAPEKLIFDIGMHKCEDSSYYLAKGFRVVAVEANPVLVEAARTRFAAEIDAGDLTVIHAALTDRDDEEITFFINEGLTDWSSIHKPVAARDGTTPKEVKVGTITLATIVRQYGSPYYAKVDIEGEDVRCAAHLRELDETPRYVSFELSDVAILSHLHMAGYVRFQLVNQTINYARRQPNREGIAIDWTFSGDNSGLFGLDLQDDKWVDLNTAFTRFLAYNQLRAVDSELGIGWVDVHARHA